uniref:Conotoxin n=1 Tax=Steinernema glaseri TaxID=37863 RepID=A0A1I7YT19_9BILA
MTCFSSWVPLLVLLIMCSLAAAKPSLTNSDAPLDDVFVRSFLNSLEVVKRSGDSCGCNMGCFYRSAGLCASCCSLGL